MTRVFEKWIWNRALWCVHVSFRREFAELMEKYSSNHITASGRISPTQLSTGKTHHHVRHEHSIQDKPNPQTALWRHDDDRHDGTPTAQMPGNSQHVTKSLCGHFPKLTVLLKESITSLIFHFHVCVSQNCGQNILTKYVLTQKCPQVLKKVKIIVLQRCCNFPKTSPLLKNVHIFQKYLHTLKILVLSKVLSCQSGPHKVQSFSPESLNWSCVPVFLHPAASHRPPPPSAITFLLSLPRLPAHLSSFFFSFL